MAETKPKLHELLAVVGDLATTSRRVSEDTTSLFKDSVALFMGLSTSTKMLDASRSEENTSEEKQMATTVVDELKAASKSLSRHMDAVLQMDSANQEATANLIVDGEVLGENLPATFLLGLENNLKRLRSMYDAIPTLKSGLKWEKDVNAGNNVYVAPEYSAFRTEKVANHKVLYEATKEHPAQIEKWYEDRPIARVTRVESSGMLPAAAKAAVLSRIDSLIRATKRARQRANSTEVKDLRIGKEIFEFIHGEEVR